MHSAMGAYHYQAPEILKNKQINKKSDIW